MDDKRPDNVENSLAEALESEQEMSALFARFLPPEPIPPDLVERTQRIVLSEVRRTIQPAVGKPQLSAASGPERLRLTVEPRFNRVGIFKLRVRRLLRFARNIRHREASGG